MDVDIAQRTVFRDTCTTHTLYHRKGRRNISGIHPRHKFYQNDSNEDTADVIEARRRMIVMSQGTVNRLVAFYDIHGSKGECYSFLLSPHET
jgi:hypothetical protein